MIYSVSLRVFVEWDSEQCLHYNTGIDDLSSRKPRSRSAPPRWHLLCCAAVHIMGNDLRASLFPTSGIELCGHELPETRVFMLYLLQVVSISEE
jgi:hypothetical protein